MKQRSMILAVAAMMPIAVAVAQTPPTPPATPVTPVTPVTPSTPVTPIAPLIPLYPDMIDREEIRRMSEDARWQGQLAAEAGRRIAEEGRWIAEEARRAAEDARLQMKDMKFDFNHDFKFDLDMSKLSGQLANFNYTPMPQGQPGVWSIPGQMKWIQGDPADSIYVLGREAFSRQDYSRAAARFAEVIAKYPNYRRFDDAVYYQAFALHRIGTMESLRQGLKVLETNQSRLAYNRSSNDAPGLQARILRALAERNEPSADAKLKDLYARYPSTTCDTENAGIQSQVLSSLYHSDPDAALPHIRNALAKRDACSAEIRKSAVVLLANRPSEENAAILINVARTDTVREVRSRAIDYLSRMPGEASINALMELMRDSDENIQRAAVRSLMRSDNVKARSALRTAMLDRRDAPESQRREAVRSLGRDNMTQEDALYLRNMFNRKDESESIKGEILNVLAQVPSEENIKFLLDVAKNPNESSTLRSRALRTVTRTALSTDELIKLYDATDNRSMRQSIVQGLSDRREQSALNKLLEIAKCSTDPEVRLLLNKNDKAVTEQVLNLMSGSGGPKC
jgi:HEAT repeat protein